MKPTIESLIEFTATLSTLDWRLMTASDKKKISKYIESDGCTGVPDFYKRCCIFHDFHYYTHLDFDLTSITKKEADKRLRQCIQSRSFLGAVSPMAWWRYWGVRVLGGGPWDKTIKGDYV